jgi:hypothetical protein
VCDRERGRSSTTSERGVALRENARRIWKRGTSGVPRKGKVFGVRGKGTVLRKRMRRRRDGWGGGTMATRSGNVCIRSKTEGRWSTKREQACGTRVMTGTGATRRDEGFVNGTGVWVLMCRGF